MTGAAGWRGGGERCHEIRREEVGWGGVIQGDFTFVGQPGDRFTD